MNRALLNVIVLLLFFFTTILAQDYKEDDQNNAFMSKFRLIAKRIPLQNYRGNERDLKHSKPKMKNPPRKIKRNRKLLFKHILMTSTHKRIFLELFHFCSTLLWCYDTYD
jgi:hypothetical protein